MKKINQEKGITLVGLVVTIIIILLLAGVSISMLVGDNGILSKATLAKKEQSLAEFKEKVNLSVTDYISTKTLDTNNAYNSLVGSLQNYGLSVDETTLGEGHISALSIPENTNDVINMADISLDSGEVTYTQATASEIGTNISIKANLASGIEADGHTVDVTVISASNSLDTATAYKTWTTNTTEPTSGWEDLSLTGTANSKTGSANNSSTVAGDYYLWVKVIVDTNETLKRFGPYVVEGPPSEENIIISKILDTSKDDPETTVTLGVTKAFLGYTLKYSTDNGSTYTNYTGALMFTNTQITNAGGQITITAQYSNGTVTVNKSLIIEVVEVPNDPDLGSGTTGMKGVYWDASGNEVEVTAANKANWYDYANKKWANAKTADGSYWVWIPRYEYKIPTPHTSTAQTIDVKFKKATSTAATSGYTVHPAFTFGYTELSGIWVAKFEASGTTSLVDVKPNVVSLRTISIGDMFTACRNMETNERYGWGTSGTEIDTHLMKNVEWGAAAYLSSSKYGKTGEVWINPNSDFITGQAGTSVNSEGTATTYSYNDTVYGVNASTTGNIYGIYDMSGGAWEYTAAYVNDGRSNLQTNGASLVNSSDKYKDVYILNGDTSTGNYEATLNRKGDSIYETSVNGIGQTSWNSDFSVMPYGGISFFVRGGWNTNVNGAGTFAFYCNYGEGVMFYGFRPVLAVASGL